MKFPKLLALLLCLTLLFCSCGAGSTIDTPSQDTTSADTTAAADDTTVLDVEPLSLPELDYGKEKVTILSGTAGNPNELVVEELNNDIVNDAIFNRKIFVEDLLGVELSFVSPQKMVRDEIERMFTAGDDEYYFVDAISEQTVSTASKGYYLELSDLPYLTLETSPWWYQDYMVESRIGDSVYFATGSLSLTTLQSLFVLAYNKDLAEMNNIPSLYDSVFDGSWTLDKMMETVSDLYLDLNGNSERDDEDLYGLVGGELFADPFWVSFDIDLFGRDENNYLTYNLNLDKFSIAFMKTYSLVNEPGVQIHTSNALKLFSDDQALLCAIELGNTGEPSFRNMTSTYGIIPVPKYDEKQEGYYTMPHDAHTTFGIPGTVTEHEAEVACAILEAMSWYSYVYVTPAYLDTTVKGKYANDPETRQIIDLITNGIRFTSAWIYANRVRALPQMWRYKLIDNQDDYASELQQRERSLNILLKELNGEFEALENS